ncbi:MAG: hypothetical protein SGPRY_007290 [Prymnesium sp.]
MAMDELDIEASKVRRAASNSFMQPQYVGITCRVQARCRVEWGGGRVVIVEVYLSMNDYVTWLRSEYVTAIKAQAMEDSTEHPVRSPNGEEQKVSKRRLIRSKDSELL